MTSDVWLVASEKFMDIKSFENLNVWQKSVQLAVSVYDLSKKLPREELYGISDQIKRSSVSVPSNIAEGCSRDSTKEFLRFLSISRGSLAELETQLVITVRTGLLSVEDVKDIRFLIVEIGKMISGLQNKLRLKLAA